MGEYMDLSSFRCGLLVSQALLLASLKSQGSSD
jgi:hypothetical protein